MADLDTVDAAGNTKLVGSDSEGSETTMVGATPAGELMTQAVIVGQDGAHEADVRQGADGIRRLDVRAQVGSSPGGFPLIDGSKWFLPHNWVEVTLPSGWQTLWGKTGEGIFHGAHVQADTDKLEMRFLVNGVEKFIVDAKTIDGLDFTVNKNQRFQASSLFVTNGDDIDFSPRHDIYFSQSCSIQVRKTDGNPLKVKSWFVQYSNA